MKKILILGGGTAGTMMANKLFKALDRQEWEITIVDQHKTHYYQPGFLFIPFGIYNKVGCSQAQRRFFPCRRKGNLPGDRQDRRGREQGSPHGWSLS